MLLESLIHSRGDVKEEGEEPAVEREEETESEDGIELVCREEEEEEEEVIVTERRREGARVPICLTTFALW